MKKIAYLLLCATVALCSITPTAAQTTGFKRIIEPKSYPLLIRALNIDHTNGNLTIDEWDRNEIEMTADITTTAVTSWMSKEISRFIDVRIVPHSTKGITIKTTVDYERLWKVVRKKYNCKINITVKIPRSIAVIIKSRHGDVNVNATVEFLRAEVMLGDMNIEHVENRCVVENSFGNITIKKADGSVNSSIENGNLTIGRVPVLTSYMRYGKATIDSVDKIYGSMKYSTFKVKQVDNVAFSYIGYSKCYIDDLKSNMKVENVKYSTLDATIADSFSDVSIEGSHSPITLRFDPNSTFNCDVSNSYGDERYSVGFKAIASGNASTIIRKIGIAGKDCTVKDVKTDKSVTIKNRYSSVALIKK